MSSISITQSQRNSIVTYAGIAAFLVLSLWLIVIAPMGPDLSMIPGDIGDARFNNFVLEHFYRWLIGKEAGFWDARIFYPVPKTIAFSDSFLGNGWFYAFFRLTGSDRETAFQYWYIFGFCLNYLAAAYVLMRLNFKPVAIATGAFFFTFGIPVLVREGHAQLVYRFPVPLACLMLWSFFQNPRFRSLLSVGFWLVWQFFLSIYLGFFLAMLLTVIALLLPLSLSDCTFRQRITAWPLRLKSAWAAANILGRLATIAVFCALLAALYLLFRPYLWVSTEYGFTRSWEEVSSMLPRWQSYLIADLVSWWQPISSQFTDIPMRHEQQS